MPGFIKLHRELIKKPIWLNSTPEQKSILIAILLSVNFVEKGWEWKSEKYKVLPGQMITSLDSIKKKCGKGISIQNIRTSLKRFEKLEFLTNEPTKTGRLIIVINWDAYQIKQDEPNIDTNKDLTNDQQRPNKDLTPNKKVKKDNKGNKVKKSTLTDYLQEKIIQNNLIETKDKIFEFFNYRNSTFTKKDRYDTELKLNGLFRHLIGCRDAGLITSECIDITMESGWKTPNPDYFKKNNNKQQGNSRSDRNKQACMDFINGR
jgi:hypothetical protein